MNKFLLLALMVLMGVLAFGMGLFSDDKSATLSQYVPDSVGRLFSKSTDDKTPLEDKNSSTSSIPTLVMPNYSVNHSANDKTPNTEPEPEGFSGISGSLLEEIQQEFTPNMNKKSTEGTESSVTQVEAENNLLRSKLEALSLEVNNRTAVLKQIEKQIEQLNN
ncbi:MAG TPA: hypothetical protein EYG71_08005 [Leucothrix sp.]|nr:hypothetical protein [Leucothrix sp.]